MPDNFGPTTVEDPVLRQIVIFLLNNTNRPTLAITDIYPVLRQIVIFLLNRDEKQAAKIQAQAAPPLQVTVP